MIDCVSIATNHHFPGNILADQHRLRYREVVQKENWRDIYVLDGMEFDKYDNLASEYYIARNKEGKVVGVTRSYPTTIPYMLSDVFSNLITEEIPSNPQILEASRMVLDRSLLNKYERQPIVDKLVVAYMERGLQRNIDGYIGFMLPKIWDSTFTRAGWDVHWLGPECALPITGEVVRAALLPVNERMNNKVRIATGLHDSLLNYGTGTPYQNLDVAVYSHIEEKVARAA